MIQICKEANYTEKCLLVFAQPVVSEDQTAALMAHLFEMGFCDRQLNLRLLRKHNHNILQVVTELLQVNNNDWYSHRY